MNNTDDSNNSETNESGKVLPFRRPAPVEPTIRRRTGGSAFTAPRKSKSSKQQTTPAWKGQAARILQMALLAAAALLALKNCGKF